MNDVNTSDADRYFLPYDYRPKTRNVTTAGMRSEPYWSSLRCSTARYWQRAVYEEVRHALGNDGVKSVLDVGCGYAVKLAKILAPRASKATGVDHGEVVGMNEGAFTEARFVDVDFEVPISRLEDLPPGVRNTFDVIVCADVIEHMHDPDILLDKIRLWSHPGTRIFISTPERDALYGKPVLSARNPEHVREWNREEFSRYLESRNFDVEDIRLVRAMSFNFSRAYFAQLLSPSRGMYNMVAECRAAS